MLGKDWQKVVLSFLMILFSGVLFAQTDTFSDSINTAVVVDTLQKVQEDISENQLTKPRKKKEFVQETPVRKAMLFSAVLPGLGQAYNKKYWKIPIVYGGAAGLLSIVKYNQDLFLDYREALLINLGRRVDNGNPLTKLSNSILRSRMDVLQRDRDFYIILTFVWYMLNIVDAGVDAHLKKFDVSEDLALHLRPSVQRSMGYASRYAGFSIGITF